MAVALVTRSWLTPDLDTNFAPGVIGQFLRSTRCTDGLGIQNFANGLCLVEFEFYESDSQASSKSWIAGKVLIMAAYRTISSFSKSTLQALN